MFSTVHTVQRKEKTPLKVTKKRKQAGVEAGGGTGMKENSGKATKTKKEGKVVK